MKASAPTTKGHAAGAIKGTAGMTMHVNDLDASARFWEQLGLARGNVDEESAALEIPGSAPLALHKWGSMCAENGGRPPGTVSGLMFDVDDAQAACDRVVRAGGRVTAPPFPGPTGGTWAVVADPDGNEFFVCAPS